MHLYIFKHWYIHRLEGLKYLVLSLPARHFSGLVGEADSPPIFLIPALWRCWHLLIGFFCFSRFITNTLALLRNLESSDLFLRVHFFDLPCPAFFWRRLQKWSDNFLSLAISIQAAEVLLPPDLLGSIWYCLWVADIHMLIWRCYLWFPRPLFYLISRWVSEVLGSTDFLSWVVFL